MAGFASFFTEGGIWMTPIAAVSVVALAVCIERIYALYVVFNANGKKLGQAVLSAVKNNQDAEAIALCDKAGKSALAHVLKNGISFAHGGEEAVATAVEEATLEVTPQLLKRTNSLGGLASLATLLGLLGTVMGLIEAFRVVAEAPADQKAVLMTKSIAVAMNTTAFGLIVAIPVTMVYLLLVGATKKITDDMDVYSLKLENVLRLRKR
ncbi:MAG: MotA/TolQ/ExbB proton channel family protein [Myxococcales bacterium]|nr:MotA/TolQ/ExbB proton channel family protein [Myxococcales bacterium]USN50216.1 MAG: MotA/TolQ/ExbB proton channel family protein [Myxococcales bacterium]